MKPVGVIVCRRGGRVTCKYCSWTATKLCDYPVTRAGKPGTCDINLCELHATPCGPGLDHCRPHAAIVKKETSK